MNQNLLRILYESFNARDIEAVLDALGPDVKWANGLEGGFVLGRDNVRQYWTRQFATLRPQLSILDFKTDEQERQIVRAHQTVRDLQGALLLEQEVGHRFTFEGGLVSLFEIVELEGAAQGAGGGES